MNTKSGVVQRLDLMRDAKSSTLFKQQLIKEQKDKLLSFLKTFSVNKEKNPPSAKQYGCHISVLASSDEQKRKKVMGLYFLKYATLSSLYSHNHRCIINVIILVFLYIFTRISNIGIASAATTLYSHSMSRPQLDLIVESMKDAVFDGQRETEEVKSHRKGIFSQ